MRARRRVAENVAMWLGLSLAHAAGAVVFTVTNNGDTGAGSLRAAIVQANTNGSPTADTIRMAITGTGTTIALASPLPALTEPVIIDGTLQPGFAGVPVVVIDGGGAVAGNGFTVEADGCTIKGLAVVGMAGHGLHIAGAGSTLVQGCWLGVRPPAGASPATQAGNSGCGVVISGGGAANAIGSLGDGLGCLISGNGKHGVLLLNAGATNQVKNDRIGTTPDGTGAMANAESGVAVSSTSSFGIIGCQISGNGQRGIVCSGGSGGSIVNCLIGADRTGAVGLANGAAGVELIGCANTQVGRAVASQGNTISGNGGPGIVLSGTGTTGCQVRNNRIGLSADGAGRLGNNGPGIRLTAGAHDNTIGGLAALEANAVSANTTGIELIGSHANQVACCTIGLAGDGGAAVGNTEAGVLIAAGSRNNLVRGSTVSGNDGYGVVLTGQGTSGNRLLNCTIGADAAGTTARANGLGGVALSDGANGCQVEGCDVVFNRGGGIVLASTAGTGNRLLGNRCHDNERLGIDLVGGEQLGNRVTLNDRGDGDTGPNGLLNFPVLDLAMVTSDGAALILTGFARPGSVIEVFRAKAAGYGEGVQSIALRTEGSSSDADGSTGGYANPYAGSQQGSDQTNRFRFQIAMPTGLSAGDWLTATASKAEGTSEQCANVQLVGPPSRLRYVSRPQNAIAGQRIAPVQRVEVQDAAERLVPLTGQAVDMALMSGNATVPLVGTSRRLLARGVALFDDLATEQAGVEYRMVARSTEVAQAPLTAASETFAVGHGALDTARGEVTLAPAQAPADGVAVVTAAIRLLDRFGNPVPDVAAERIRVSALGDGAGVLRIEQPSRATGPDGRTTATITSLVPVRCGVHVTVDNAGLAAEPAVEFVVAHPDKDASEVFVEPNRVVADGREAAQVRITLLRPDGTPRSGVPAGEIRVLVDPTDTPVAITQPSRPTDDKGVTTAELRGTAPGVVEVRVEVYGLGLAARPKLEFVPRRIDPRQCQVEVVRERIAADGVDEAEVVVTLRDAEGQPVVGSPASERELLPPFAGALRAVDLGRDSDRDGVFRARITMLAVGEQPLSLRVAGIELPAAKLVGLAFADYDLRRGLRYIGTPVQLEDPEWSRLLATPGLRLLRWDPLSERYVRLESGGAGLMPGQGVWLASEADQRVRLLGLPPAGGRLTTLLARGWNQMANPFAVDLPWTLSEIQVYIDGAMVGTLADEALWADTILPYGWTYPAGSGDPVLVFDPSRPGFESLPATLPATAPLWLMALRDGVSISLAEPKVATTRHTRAASDRASWAVGLVVASGDHAVSGRVFGVSSGLSRALALASPPALHPPAVDLSFLAADGRSRLAGDLRPAAAGELVWEAVVTSREAAEVTVSWPSFGRQVPPGWTVVLDDLQAATTSVLNTRAAYRYQVSRAGEQRRFRITARRGAIGRAVITSLTAQPGRDGSTRIAMALSEPAEVSLVVVSPGGRTVAEVARNRAAGEVVTLWWNGRDAAGRPVPRGLYRLEATVVSTDGAITRASRVLTLR